MRICFVAPSVSLDQGGPSVFALSVSDALRGLGNDVRLLTTDWSAGSSRLSESEVFNIGQHTFVGHGSWPSRLRHSNELVREMRRVLPSADIVHIDGFFLSPVWFGSQLASSVGTPFVIMPHGNFEPFQLAQGRLQKRAYRLLGGSRILNRAAGFVFTAESERLRARSYLPASSHSAVIPLGAAVDAPQLHAQVDAWLGGVPRQRVVLFLGRLARKKQPDLLVEAWGRIPESVRASARLVIAGPPDDFTERDLRDMVHSRQLTASVIVAGRVSRPQSSWLFSRAGTFVLPTLNENYGMTVVEAMSHGCSVLTTSDAAAADMVKRANGGVVLERPNAQELSLHLSRFLNDESATVRYGALGQRFASRELTWASTARRLADFYQTCLSRT